MTLSSDQIAEKFSKGKACQFWLTQKQAKWILDVWHREHRTANTHFGRSQAKGQFENENGFHIWEANEGYHGSALFTVKQAQEEECKKHPLQQLAENKGLDFDKIVNNNPEILAELVKELNS